MRRELERALLNAIVHAALEALAGIGHEPVAPRAPSNCPWREPGDFERDIARRARDRAALAAHDAGQPQDRLRIGDHEHVGGELDVAAVQ